jgi:hypothetical protein
MIQVPFGLTVAVVLAGAVAAGGAIGIMSPSPPSAPTVQAGAPPPAASPIPSTGEPSTVPMPRQAQDVPNVPEIAPLPTRSSATIGSQSSSEETVSTTTFVPTPVIVAGWGVVRGCGRTDDCFRPKVAQEHHLAARSEPRFVRHAEAKRQLRPAPRAAHSSVHVAAAAARH